MPVGQCVPKRGFIAVGLLQRRRHLKGWSREWRGNVRDLDVCNRSGIKTFIFSNFSNLLISLLCYLDITSPEFPPGWIGLRRLRKLSWVQLLFTDRTIFINPVFIWTRNVFHQLRGSIRSVFELISSLFHSQDFFYQSNFKLKKELIHQFSFYFINIVS